MNYYKLMLVVLMQPMVARGYTGYDGYGAIHSLLSRYSRSITILEITQKNSMCYSLDIARHYPQATCVVVAHGRTDSVADILEQHAITNLVLLDPPALDTYSIDMLGKCEHFDVVIVHDVEALDQKNVIPMLRLLLKLGDHIFIDSAASLRIPEGTLSQQSEVVATHAGRSFLYFEVLKSNLLLPRWSIRGNAPFKHYEVMSNFHEKKLYKRATKTTSHWIPGINLLTFIMLQGLYPTNKMIRKHLKSFKDIDHNDLVLGNMVVQGASVVPIDFRDRRRNIHPEVCIKAAKKVFRLTRRFDSPRAALIRYSAYLHKHKRHVDSF